MGPQPADARADEHALLASLSAIIHDYPNASPQRVEHLLRKSYERTSGPPVQLYRVLLAERDARVQLRRDERTEAAARTPAVDVRPVASPDPEPVVDLDTTITPRTRGLAWTS